MTSKSTKREYRMRKHFLETLTKDSAVVIPGGYLCNARPDNEFFPNFLYGIDPTISEGLSFASCYYPFYGKIIPSVVPISTLIPRHEISLRDGLRIRKVGETTGAYIKRQRHFDNEMPGGNYDQLLQILKKIDVGKNDISGRPIREGCSSTLFEMIMTFASHEK